MSADGHDPMPDDIENAEVSRLYRQAAQECAPGHLDAAVLDAARKAAAGSRYSHAIHWLRPMAWAATIGLCLAIVVELSLYAPGSPELAVPVAAPQPESEMLLPGRSDSPAEAAKAGTLEAEVALDEEVATAGRTEPEAWVSPEIKTRPRPAAATEMPAAAAYSFPEDRADLAERSEEAVARLRAADEDAGAASRALNLEGAAALAAIPVAPCPIETRTDPERWLECIEALEDAGREAEAEEQRELLTEAFPEFDADK
ncbi:MAG: hypothetical protein QNJ00_08505 [Woeseiaceae bacterium]|nr:hypothetical protein [Woeseiaceae bacterium]